MRRKLIFFLYRVFTAIAFPFIVLYVVFRGLRDLRYFRALGERFGLLPASYRRTAPGAIWLHAVSVGEVLSAAALVRRLAERHTVFLSCTTLTGREVARQKLGAVCTGIFYAPIDAVFTVRCVLRAIRPVLVVIFETEVWPNLFRETKRGGAALLVANGRISKRALPRYRRLRWFFRSVLDLPDRLLVQSEQDRAHYLEAGAPPDRPVLAGNLKYDFDPAAATPPAALAGFFGQRAGAPVLIAASTMGPVIEGDPDEDDIVIAACTALRQRHPDLVLLVVPRKPERFDVVAEKLRSAGIEFARRSAMNGGERANAVLLDTMGELGSVFRYAGIVFVGGSLVSQGGHNILEPAFFGKPVIVGPHMQNFAAIAERFAAARALVQIDEPAQLAPAVAELLDDPRRRAELGERARRAAEAERGATERCLAHIEELYESAVPLALPYGPMKPLLWAASKLWAAGGRTKRDRDFGQRACLATPVVSIGGLSMGGAGKTPFVSWLARCLRAQGLQPAILTRGYRRRRSEPVTVVASGVATPIQLTGDEAQILLRDAQAPLGIARERKLAAAIIENRFRPDLFLLDDGFQHARLARDLDIVLIDALDPVAGGAVFPLGRLREPLAALARADAFVITRAGPRRTYTGIRNLLKQYAPGAPIFLARVVPRFWCDLTGGRLDPQALAAARTAAFCGLAQPEAFWQTLEALGCEPVERHTFPDHHRYSEAELRELARGGGVLLTTEKDLMNLPEDASRLLGDVKLYWLKIDLEVQGETELIEMLQAVVECRRALRS